MHQATEPTHVRISDAEQTLTLTWADGHTSAYPWWFLRGFCPCATCQGHGGDSQFVSHADAAQLTDVDEVGHYGLRIVWNVSHTTGIYAFDFLRQLCPCPACLRSIGPGHAWHKVPAEAVNAAPAPL